MLNCIKFPCVHIHSLPCNIVIIITLLSTVYRASLCKFMYKYLNSDNDYYYNRQTDFSVCHYYYNRKHCQHSKYILLNSKIRLNHHSTNMPFFFTIKYRKELFLAFPVYAITVK